MVMRVIFVVHQQFLLIQKMILLKYQKIESVKNAPTSIELVMKGVSDMKQTQGKWSVHNFECADRNGGCFIKDNDGEDLAKVYGDREEDLANANLIASAPEMLEMLKRVVDGKKSIPRKEVRKLISKAGGE